MLHAKEYRSLIVGEMEKEQEVDVNHSQKSRINEKRRFGEWRNHDIDIKYF